MAQLKGAVMAVHKLERTDAVAPGYLRVFDVDGRPVLLVCGEQGPVAVDNICPHAGAPLSDGRVSGNRLRCARHGYIFDLETGACARGRREGFGGLRFHDLKEVDGFLTLESEKS